MPSKPADVQPWLIDIRHHIYLARNFIDGFRYEQPGDVVILDNPYSPDRNSIEMAFAKLKP